MEEFNALQISNNMKVRSRQDWTRDPWQCLADHCSSRAPKILAKPTVQDYITSKKKNGYFLPSDLKESFDSSVILKQNNLYVSLSKNWSLHGTFPAFALVE
jgi:hypothetical protein